DADLRRNGNDLNDPASALLDTASGIREVSQEAPDASMSSDGPMAGDPLSDVLKTVRLTGATFFDIEARGAWAGSSPQLDMILPKIRRGADHLIVYRGVPAGSCFGTIAGGEPIALNAGDAIVFTHGDHHVMSSKPGMDAPPTTRDVVEVAAAT